MLRLIPIFAVLVLLTALPSCRNESWRQKLTVVVETPNGEVSGSSVTEITKRDQRGNWFFPDARGVYSEVKGEAVAVEVLPGKWLFALLDGREDGKGKVEYLVYPAFALDKATDANGRRSYEAAMAKLHAQPLDTPAMIPASDYPLMVTFDDINDPASVKRVDSSDLAAGFGPGVSLKAVTLEITDEPVTDGRVEAVLAWWLDTRSGPYNEMTPLKLPNASPRGWNHLGASAFWSLEYRQRFDRRAP
jgi:hypothetical protein